MKKIYAALASVALLFSLPAIAAPLAEKSLETKGEEKGNHEKAPKDILNIEKGPMKEASSPHCRVGSG